MCDLKRTLFIVFLKDDYMVCSRDNGMAKKYLNNLLKRHTNIVAVLIVLVRLTIWHLDRYCQANS